MANWPVADTAATPICKDIWRWSHFRLTRFAHMCMLIPTFRAPYKHDEALRRESKGKQQNWLSPYYCHNHLLAVRVKGCHAD